MGPSFTYTSTDTTAADTFIAEADPYGSGKFTHAGGRASFGIDTRDHLGTPSRGIRIEGGAGAFPTMFDATAGFAEVHGEVATYLSPPGANPVLAESDGQASLGRASVHRVRVPGGTADCALSP